MIGNIYNGMFLLNILYFGSLHDFQFIFFILVA